MGKGYQSSQGKFIDFIADPNFDMHMKLADQEVKEHYARTALLNAAPDIQIDMWDDAHRDLVAEKKQAYQDRIEKITKSIVEAEDLSNINKFMPELKSLKRELTQDFTKGDLYNVQKTAENHRKFQEELSKIKDPGRKAAYIKEYQDKYLGGDRKEAFEYNPLMDSRNIDAEFLKSDFFRQLPERVRSGVTFDKVGGGMMLKRGATISEKEAERIQDAYKQFVNSDPTIKSYAEESQNVLKEQGWLNENKELDFSEKGRLGQGMRNIGDMMSYRNVTGVRKDYVDDPFDLTNEARKAGVKQRAEDGGIFTGSHLEGEWTLNTATGRKLIEQKAQETENLLKLVSTDTWLANYMAADNTTKADMIEKRKEKVMGMTIKVDGKTLPHPLIKELQKLDAAYEAAVDFGTRKYQGLFRDTTESKAFQKAIDSGDFARGMMGEKGSLRMYKDSNKLVELNNLNDLVGEIYHRPGSKNDGKRILKIVPTKKDNFFPGNHNLKKLDLTGGVGRFRLIFEDDSKKLGYNFLSVDKENKDENVVPPNEEIVEYYTPELDLKPYFRFNQ